MASVVLQGRNIRRARTARISDQDVFRLDNQKDVAANLREVLVQLIRQDVSRMRKLSCYNATCRLMYRVGPHTDVGFRIQDILACLRPGLFSGYKEIRTACLRAIRYCCNSYETVTSLLTLHMDYMIVRSLDIRLDNEVERVHALRLIRKIMLIDPLHFPLSLLRPIISIANDGMKERDKLVRTCLATISELTLYNGELVAKASGISTILHSILECHSLSRVNESLVATIIYLLNRPSTRCFIWSGVDLEQMLAPFTDIEYKVVPESANDHSGEEIEQRYEACKMALVCILKSWPGIYWLCRPSSSALRNLVGMLHLPNMENRKEIMNVIYDVFRLSIPDWTDSFDQALISIDLSEMNDGWKLLEGFVVDEGKCLLPHCSKTRPDLVVTHTALLLAIFIEADLLGTLVKVIVNSNRFIAVRATILLGELLYMSSQLLPLEISRYHQCLPSLISQAAKFDTSSHQYLEANAAVRCLQRIHIMRRRGCVPASLFLDQLLYGVHRHSMRNEKQTSSSSVICGQCGDESVTEQNKERQDKEREAVSQAIRDSQVLYTKDNNSWNWTLVSVILSWPDVLRRMQDQLSQRFIRRLLFVLTPSKRIYSVIDLSSDTHRSITQSALNLIDFLTSSVQPFCDEIEKSFKEFLDDIAACLNEMKSGTKSIKETPIFSPSNLAYTCCQNYFLFIGRFSMTDRGNTLLEDSRIYQSLMLMVSSTTHDSYIKLIVSSLDYNREGSGRLILSKALKATSETARQYVTGFMRVLMRARVEGFSEWGIEALVAQLYDSSSAIAMEALSVLSEATAIKSHLISLIRLKPSVLHLGHKGELLLVKFLSIEFGFRELARTVYISNELEKWRSSFNIKYVGIVEERLNEALTTYEKTYDGSYVRRSHHRTPRKDVYLPVHLYSQLVRHAEGCALLAEQPYLETEIFHRLRKTSDFDPAREEDIVRMKACLWASGHIGRSEAGVEMLHKHAVIEDMIRLAGKCLVYSVRGTAYYALGLIGGTTRGADLLQLHGWETVRHARPESERFWFSAGTDLLELHETDVGSDSSVVRLDSDVEKLSEKRKERANFESSQEPINRPSFYMLGLDGAADSSSSSGGAGYHLDHMTGSVKSDSRSTGLLRNISPDSADVESGDGVGSSGGRSARYLSESGGRGISSLGSVKEEPGINFEDDVIEEKTATTSIRGKTVDFAEPVKGLKTGIQKPSESISKSSARTTSAASTTASDAEASATNATSSASTSIRHSVSPRLSSLDEDAVLEIPVFRQTTKPLCGLRLPDAGDVEMNGSLTGSIDAEAPLTSLGSDVESNFITAISPSPAGYNSLTISPDSNELNSARYVSGTDSLRMKTSSAKQSFRVSIDGSDLTRGYSTSDGGSVPNDDCLTSVSNEPSSPSSATLPMRGLTSPCLTAMGTESIAQEQRTVGLRGTVELRNKEGFHAWREIRSSARYNSIDHVSSIAEPSRVSFSGFSLEKRASAVTKSKSLDYRASKTRSSLRNLVPKRQSKPSNVCSHCGSIERRDRKSSSGHSFAFLSRVAAPNLEHTPGGPEFIGIAMPVDLSSIFYEARSNACYAKDLSNKQHSSTDDSTIKIAHVGALAVMSDANLTSAIVPNFNVTLPTHSVPSTTTNALSEDNNGSSMNRYEPLLITPVTALPSSTNISITVLNTSEQTDPFIKSSNDNYVKSSGAISSAATSTAKTTSVATVTLSIADLPAAGAPVCTATATESIISTAAVTNNEGSLAAVESSVSTDAASHASCAVKSDVVTPIAPVCSDNADVAGNTTLAGSSHPIKSSKIFSTSRADECNTDLDVEVHTVEGCLACFKIRTSLELKPPSGASELNRMAEVYQLKIEINEKSLAEESSETANSADRDEISEEMLDLRTVSGRTKIKKEIIRIVINLSSSIGVKNLEQALLVLKQKYAVMFQDLCLYSQVSALLATYNYRIACRRFIQELFQELDVTPCMHDPCAILGLNEDELVGAKLDGKMDLEEEGENYKD